MTISTMQCIGIPADEFSGNLICPLCDKEYDPLSYSDHINRPRCSVLRQLNGLFQFVKPEDKDLANIHLEGLVAALYHLGLQRYGYRGRARCEGGGWKNKETGHVIKEQS